MEKNHYIRNVLILSSVLVFGLAIFGGYTRLKKAGLSITEWKPITGIIPPLSDAEWKEEFEKYKKIAQYRLIHRDITLKEFKRIYLIEYFHRLLARLAGLFVFGAFLWLYFKKHAKGRWILYFIAVFLLFGIQGFLGWLMVRTGVVGEIPFVDPVFLAFHKIFAIFVFSFILFGAFVADNGELFKKLENSEKLRFLSFLALLVFLIQTFFGALLAGTKGALVAPTYPDINGEILPSYALSGNIIKNPSFVNFFHRHFAWILLVLFLLIARYSKVGFIGVFLWGVQFILGLLTLINSRGDIPLHFALFHQANAWIILYFILFVFFSSFRK